MDQLICASLSHTHDWYEVGMLKVVLATVIWSHMVLEKLKLNLINISILVRLFAIDTN